MPNLSQYCSIFTIVTGKVKKEEQFKQLYHMNLKNWFQISWKKEREKWKEYSELDPEM